MLNHRPTIKEIKALIRKRIDRSQAYIDACRGETSPQIIALKLQHEGELRALQDCLRALNGDAVDLRSTL